MIHISRFSHFHGGMQGPSGPAAETLPVHWSQAVLTFWPQFRPYNDRLWSVKGLAKVLSIKRASV